jgi:hypothetical protein
MLSSPNLPGRIVNKCFCQTFIILRFALATFPSFIIRQAEEQYDANLHYLRISNSIKVKKKEVEGDPYSEFVRLRTTALFFFSRNIFAAAADFFPFRCAQFPFLKWERFLLPRILTSLI